MAIGMRAAATDRQSCVMTRQGSATMWSRARVIKMPGITTAEGVLQVIDQDRAWLFSNAANGTLPKHGAQVVKADLIPEADPTGSPAASPAN